MDTTKWFAARVMALLVLAAIQLSIPTIAEQPPAKEQYRPTARYIEHEKLIKSTQALPNAFMAVESSLIGMLDELKLAKQAGKELGEFDNMRKEIKDLLAVADEKAEKCPVVLKDIKRLRKLHKLDINLKNYLKFCKKMQRDFCKRAERGLGKQEKRFKAKVNAGLNQLQDGAKLDKEGTMEVISKILTELKDARVDYGGRLLPQYQLIEDNLQLLQAVCLKGAINCDDVFGSIKSLRRQNPKLNHYLDECEQIQKDYCRP